jgi:hypothetical protein
MGTFTGTRERVSFEVKEFCANILDDRRRTSLGGLAKTRVRVG